MKIDSVSHLGCFKDLDSCPESSLCEFVFVGRSNVGKSSLINMLTGVKNLAKVSGTPGKTRLINFFSINEKWTLVDLPGYGYAKLPKFVKNKFNTDVSNFLTGRANLSQVFALLDSQLNTLNTDLAFLGWLQQCKISYSVILTKVDRSSKLKIKNNEGQLMLALDKYDLKPNKIFKCSARIKIGRSTILNWIETSFPEIVSKKKVNSLQLNWMKK